MKLKRLHWYDIVHWKIFTNAYQAIAFHSWPDIPEAATFKGRFEGEEWGGSVSKGIRDADYAEGWKGKILPFDCHFYDPDTGKSYGGSTEYTAYKYCLETFRVAKTKSYDPYYLGLSIHYLCDMAVPLHAANIINIPFIDERHSNFEKYAESNADDFFLKAEAINPDEFNPRKFKDLGTAIHNMAIESKKVWLNTLKPVYDKKGYKEAWGKEADPTLKIMKPIAQKAVMLLCMWLVYNA